MYPMHTIRKNTHVAVLFDKNFERSPSCFAFSGNNSCKIPINLKLPNINSGVSRNRSIRSKLSRTCKKQSQKQKTPSQQTHCRCSESQPFQSPACSTALLPCGFYCLCNKKTPQLQLSAPRRHIRNTRTPARWSKETTAATDSSRP